MSTQLIIPLDFKDISQAKEIVNELGDLVTWFKVGKQMFTRYGPTIVEFLKENGKHIFLDLKFHDIPNTVGMAINSAIDLEVDMVNMHASGGKEMMNAGLQAKQARNSQILLIGVTVLTSMNDANLRDIGFVNTDVQQQVGRLARLAKESGLDGVVASAHEISLIRESCGASFIQVIPGIRPKGSDSQDQKRVMTPGDASRSGAQYIVVGRPITQAADPSTVVKSIFHELED